MDKNRNDELARWEDALASDDPAERDRAREALGATAEGRELLKRQAELDEQVARYRNGTAAPPAELLDRIAKAAEAPAAAAPPVPQASTRRPIAVVAAIAASLAVLWIGRIALSPGEVPGELGEAIARVEQAQRQYVEALAELELRAGGVLAGAAQTGLAEPERRRLQALQARLQNLDGLIADVRRYLEDHPGNSGGQTALLAAYREKEVLLRQIVSPKPVGEPDAGESPDSGRGASPQGVRHAS